jgi:hypothetical protein
MLSCTLLHSEPLTSTPSAQELAPSHIPATVTRQGWSSLVVCFNAFSLWFVTLNDFFQILVAALHVCFWDISDPFPSLHWANCFLNVELVKYQMLIYIVDVNPLYPWFLDISLIPVLSVHLINCLLWKVLLFFFVLCFKFEITFICFWHC